MILGSLFSIAPMAEATPTSESSAEKFVPEIAYSNVNYTKGLVLMFAVPAPASLDEGSTVKVVIWSSPSTAFSYYESVASGTAVASATALEAEAQKATIGGKECLVYKYDGLTAEKMTNIVYARPVVVDKDGKAVSYGDVIDYSVVEYVQTAKGNFEGTPALANADVVALLDSMLDFGATSQVFLGGFVPYAPNGYLANDELHKIWITPIVAGVKQEKQFGGFFKYEEGGYFTIVSAPHFDGLAPSKYRDSEGNLLEDAITGSGDNAFGFQIAAVAGDVELVVEYEAPSIRSFVAEEFGLGFGVNNMSQVITGDPEVVSKAQWTNSITINYNGTIKSNLSGTACKLDDYDRMNYYHGVKTVEDPNDPDNVVFLVSATNGPSLEFIQTTPTDYSGFGYGDTVTDAVTLEFEIGRPNPDAKISTGAFYFRNRGGKLPARLPSGITKANTDIYLFKITNNEIYLQLDSKTKGETVCIIPETGLIKVSFTIFSDGYVHAYLRGEDGSMQKVAEGQLTNNFKIYQNAHEAYLADDNPANDNDFITFANFSNWFSMNNIEPTWTVGAGPKINADLEAAVVNINGVDTPTMNPNGSFNFNAVQIYAEQNYSFLLDNFKFFGGAIYE